MRKKPWFVRIYENPEQAKKRKKVSSDDLFANDGSDDESIIQDKDGVFYIHYFTDGINLKVLPPIGEGAPVELKEVMQKLKHSGVLSLDEPLIKKYVKNGTGGVYECVGQFQHNAAADAIFTVDIASDEMKATITASSPAVGGADLSPEKIRHQLEVQGVQVGIDDEKIEEFVDNPEYGVPYPVAFALLPVDGRDAYISYNFETDKSKIKLQENSFGQVDYKERNQIQNVVEGQPLAQKMLPERGKAGKTLFGRYLEAKNGKDIPLPLGKNVQVDTDGRTILATCNGEVLIQGGKICVEPIMELPEVSIKSGNITFLGIVRVKGDVADGYSIKATGSIEIGGSVGMCTLESEGDIVVNGGIQGKNQGKIVAGKSVWAKFINQTDVTAEEYVVVNDNIMNSEVKANKKILLRGKNAKIVGGHLFATEEVHAKVIGSAGGGSETVIEVGIDPKAKKRRDDLQILLAKLAKDMEDLRLEINQLMEQKKRYKNKLPPDKASKLLEFKKQYDELDAENTKNLAEVEEINAHLRDLKAIGKVSVTNQIYTGVTIFIRESKEVIRNEDKNVTFTLDDSFFVRHNKYEPMSEEDTKRVPNGYSSY